MITPKEGYIATGTSVTFIMKFKPTQISCLLQTQVRKMFILKCFGHCRFILKFWPIDL